MLIVNALAFAIKETEKKNGLLFAKLLNLHEFCLPLPGVP